MLDDDEARHRLAHDLKGPLSTLKLQAQTLRPLVERGAATEAASKIVAIEKQIERLRVLIDERLSAEAVVMEVEVPPPPARPAVHHTGPRVLAVDDDAHYLAALVPLLSASGFRVTTAESGEAALAIMAKQDFECVLLDSVLPGLSGMQTCVRIRAVPAWRDLPVIMVTSSETKDAMIAGMDSGADDFVAKSSDFEVLHARLNAQVRRKHFEEETRRIREELLEKRAVAAMAQQLEKKNKDLEAARAQAEQESEFKSKFLANMSHELRTPLNAVIGFSELLEQELFGPLNEQQKSYLGNVLTSGRHLLALINDVLDLSKIEAGRVELSKERLSVAEIVAGAREGLLPLAEKKRIAFTTQVAPGLPELYADRLRLNQVLYNLLSNAIKFTPDGGAVALLAERDGPLLRLIVADTGIGIKAADMKRLFREFERLTWESNDKYEGTGLGLALTKKLVEMHGGAIRVQSEPGKGSQFIVELPFGDPTAAKKRPARAVRRQD